MGERFGSGESMVGRFIKRHARAAFAAAALGSIESDQHHTPAAQEATVDVVDDAPTNEFFDGKPEYFVYHKNGDYTPEERAARTKHLKNGEEIFVDADLVFYKVQKGDTLSEIRQRLGVYGRFAHLKDQTHKLESFNIPEKRLQVGMWLPIPLENKDRHLSDEAFAAYAARAVEKMRHDNVYGAEVQRILKKASAREVVATMLAVAKQESGGRPIGNFELHRWEQGHRVFSFSLFHVLMEGAGLHARRKLGLTEGQLYHPENAARLFLAFLCEKGNAAKFFPLDEHMTQFAVFYNGGNWKKTNPHYVENVSSWYADALASLDHKKNVAAKK